MNRIFRYLARLVGSPKGAWAVVACWALLVAALASIAPGAKPYAVGSGEGSVRGDTPAARAGRLLNEAFPSDDGPVALLVFHGRAAITADERARIANVSEWLASGDKPEHVASALPFHRLPENVQDGLFSADRTTVLLNVALRPDLESDAIFETLQQIRTYAEQSGIGGLRLEITGPAGITADTITLFRNADLVLLLATVGLIVVLLIAIYRSPLLAVMPLFVAGTVYATVDRLLGLAAKNGWFLVDKQALSIMTILLFAVLTDYCLFVVSRYREELKRIGSRFDAMKAAFLHVAEPILFSGGTVLLAVTTLFAAVFAPYRHFAPVFAVAMAVMMLAGVTLVPAVFALLGRKAFWPFVPKLEEREARTAGFWTGIGDGVVKKPAAIAAVLLIVLIVPSLSIGTIKPSFNLMKSFPETISSRQGFELLEERFPPGKLAPVSVLLMAETDMTADAAFVDKLDRLASRIGREAGTVAPDLSAWRSRSAEELPDTLLSTDKRAVKLQVTLPINPYDAAALDLLESLRAESGAMLRDSGFDPSRFSLHFAGQTAEQLDVRTMNARDTVVVFSLIAGSILVMLAFQARAIVPALVMMGTMLLSYTATLGLGWTVFHHLMGHDSISYRLPMYTFVFLIALGVDYNIMLVSRIREEARTHEWKRAISLGVARTGGVISSAGLLLAATFSVLMTQPLQELFLFGMTMGIGILVDTFLVRGVLLPAILSLTPRLRSGASAAADQSYGR
ncbi:MMPL family transporter [Paenibacillus flagellatus]|uniref:MMPL family transporter n=1 Tax=Paenibacillus flagellatus TaxID=2211139 RepID=A0A2V5JZH6_9BACL|nr:MMPL family transporter [Paenibacillus flagellatus]PYI52278.1 MMPL family transporter [Paenibacillus flagellatus]